LASCKHNFKSSWWPRKRNCFIFLYL
jgi:hypothetical protein